MHVVHPRHVQLLVANHGDRFTYAVDEAFDRVTKEAERGLAGLAGLAEFAIVAVPGEIVVVRQEMCGGYRHSAAARQDDELKQPGRTAVAVSEWMDPGDVQMRVDGSGKDESELDLRIWAAEDGTVQPGD